jgi:hypothetical protein
VQQLDIENRAERLGLFCGFNRLVGKGLAQSYAKILTRKGRKKAQSVFFIRAAVGIQLLPL